MKNILFCVSTILLLSCGDSSSEMERNSPLHADLQLDVQGHRGARGHLPENSIPGFVLALEMGATTLEMDLVVSADSQLVVNHDPYLNPKLCVGPEGEPIAEGTKWILFEMPMQKIRKCDCGSKGNPRFPEQKARAVNRPALWEVLEVTEKLRSFPDSTPPFYNLELKFDPEHENEWYPEKETYVQLVLDEINRYNIADRVTLQSFSSEIMEEIHERAVDMQTSWLVEDQESVEAHLSRLSFTPTIYSPNHTSLTPERIATAHAEGCLVVPWTVNDDKRMMTLAEWGVDGIITDYPDRLSALIPKP